MRSSPRPVTSQTPSGRTHPANAAMRRHAEPDSLVTELCRGANVLRTHVERTVLRAEGVAINWTAFDVLQLVCSRPSVETRTVAAQLGVAKATVTAVTSHLLARRLIGRQLQPGDRRRVLLRATDEGRALATRLRARVADEETRLLHQPSPPNTANAARLLRHLAEGRRAYPTPGHHLPDRTSRADPDS